MHPFALALATAVALLLLLRGRGKPRVVQLGAVVVFAVSLVYGLGLIQLPDLEHTLSRVGDTLGVWTYPIVGALAFLETGAFVGLVAPGETAIIAGGVIAGQGNVEVVVLFLVVWTCAVAGDSVSFLIGRRLGRGFLLRHGDKVKITPERLAKVEAYFDRRGGLTILVGRFIGLVRAIAPFVAGASRMPYTRFLPYDLAGAGLWSAAFVLLGYAFWRNIDKAATIASRGSLVVGTTIVGGVVAFLASRYLRTSEQRAAARAWLRERRGRNVTGRRENLRHP